MKYDAIVIGGGAAGLYLAAHLSPLKVLVLEKNSRLGLKLLASGSGQCNLTHGGDIKAFYSHYGEHKNFVKFSLSHHDNKAVIRYFESHGLKCTEREDGKVFPATLRSNDVLETLLNAIRDNRNAKIMKEVKLTEVIFDESTYTVRTDHGDFCSTNLIVATGGMTYSRLGTTGDGYVIAEKLGHRVVEAKPGLTSVHCDDRNLLELSGLTFKNIHISMGREGQKTRRFTGDLLLTHFGLSGPVILDNSRNFEKGDRLEIQFVDMTYEALDRFFLEIAGDNGEKPLAFFMNKLDIPDRLKPVVLASSGAKKELRLSEVTKPIRKEIIKHLTAYPVKVQSLTGEASAMVTVGGVALEDVSAKHLMSRLKEGLYFIGEVLDIDGDSGGYNLQWAFSSAKTVADHIIKNNRQ